MPHLIKCDACSRQSSISDDVFTRRIVGKKVSLRCKHCSAPMVIDGTLAQGPTVLPGDSTKPQPAPSAEAPPAAEAAPSPAKPSPVAPSPPAPTAAAALSPPAASPSPSAPSAEVAEP